MLYFGEKLRTLRLQQGLTQQQLANRIELVKASISAYEQSKKYPSIEVLIKLCMVFNVSADYLLGLSDNIEFKKSNLTEEQVDIVRKVVSELERCNNITGKY